MPDTDYEGYLVRKPDYEEVSGLSQSRNPAMTVLSQRQVLGCSYHIEIRWIRGIPGPEFVSERANGYDEIIIYLGSDHRKSQVLGGEIEFNIGGQPVTFNTSTALFIPEGTHHGPVTWKQYRKDHLQISIRSNTVTSRPARPAENGMFDYEQYAVRSPMREAGAEFTAGRTAPTMTMMSGVQIPGVKYYIETGWTFGMPVSRIAGSGMPEMVHRKFDEIVLHIGGDPDNPEDLGGEVEFYVGGQPLVFNTTSALFIPTGLKHGPLALKKYEKPHLVMAIMCGAGTIQEGWGDSFKTS